MKKPGRQDLLDDESERNMHVMKLSLVVAIGRRSPSSIFRCPHRRRTARSGSRHTATGAVRDD